MELYNFTFMLAINFDPFPILESQNLSIRRLLPADVAEVILLRGNPQTMQYIPRPLCKTIADALALIAKFDDMIANNEGINWAVANKVDNKVIGLISFHRIEKHNYRAEIGYMILPQYQGKGLVSEGIKTLLKFGFEKLGLNSVFAIINPLNIASEMVLQRNGFKKEAYFIENEFHNGVFVDTVFYSLTKRNFNN